MFRIIETSTGTKDTVYICPGCDKNVTRGIFIRYCKCENCYYPLPDLILLKRLIYKLALFSSFKDYRQRENELLYKLYL